MTDHIQEVETQLVDRIKQDNWWDLQSSMNLSSATAVQLHGAEIYAWLIGTLDLVGLTILAGRHCLHLHTKPDDSDEMTRHIIANHLVDHYINLGYEHHIRRN